MVKKDFKSRPYWGVKGGLLRKYLPNPYSYNVLNTLYQPIGLSTGGVEGDASPPEFDMGGTYGKMSPPEFQQMQLKKYNVNISDTAITLPLEQHLVWELVVLQTNQIRSR